MRKLKFLIIGLLSLMVIGAISQVYSPTHAVLGLEVSPATETAKPQPTTKKVETVTYLSAPSVIAETESSVTAAKCHGHKTPDGWVLDAPSWSASEVAEIAQIRDKAKAIDPTFDVSLADIAGTVDQMVCQGTSHDAAIKKATGIALLMAKWRHDPEAAEEEVRKGFREALAPPADISAPPAVPTVPPAPPSAGSDITTTDQALVLVSFGYYERACVSTLLPVRAYEILMAYVERLPKEALAAASAAVAAHAAKMDRPAFCAELKGIVGDMRENFKHLGEAAPPAAGSSDNHR